MTNRSNNSKKKCFYMPLPPVTSKVLWEEELVSSRGISGSENATYCPLTYEQRGLQRANILIAASVGEPGLPRGISLYA